MPRLGFYGFYEFLCKNGVKWVIIRLLGLIYWVIVRGRNPKPDGFCRSLVRILRARLTILRAG